jgi:hypothetical protein
VSAAALDALCLTAKARGEVVLYIPPHVRRYPDGVADGWHPSTVFSFVAVRPPATPK